jgi:dephospho-CoA kinase
VTSLHRRWLLTGGIGSGKSEVRRLLEKAGIRTIDADSVGHAVLREEAFSAVSGRWPDVVVDGAIDRSRLAGIVFADPRELAALEAITHPSIFGRIEVELKGFDGTAVVEMPLLNRVEGWPVIVVDAPDDIRLERVLARGMAMEDAERRMRSQPSRGDWLARGDIVVPNHQSLDDLDQTVLLLARHLIMTPDHPSA